MKKDNIVLIGMPGVGKSTVGVILAKVLGFQFVDADLVIQEKEGKLLREIIAEEGPDGFIAVENRISTSFGHCYRGKCRIWKRGNGALKADRNCDLFKIRLCGYRPQTVGY